MPQHKRSQRNRIPLFGGFIAVSKTEATSVGMPNELSQLPQACCDPSSTPSRSRIPVTVSKQLSKGFTSKGGRFRTGWGAGGGVCGEGGGMGADVDVGVGMSTSVCTSHAVGWVHMGEAHLVIVSYVLGQPQCHPHLLCLPQVCWADLVLPLAT